MDRIALNTNTIATGVFFITSFTALQSFTSSQLSFATGTVATGITTARIGLYTVNASNVATLVAETANDTSLFATSATVQTRSFSTARGLPATYNIVAGQRYAIGAILVSSTSGQLWGFNIGAQALRTVSPAITGGVAGQTDLVTPFTINGSSIAFWGRVS